jgi:adenylate cyclase
MLRFGALLKKVFIGGLLGCSAALVAAVVGLLPFAETVELKTYDLRVRLTANPTAARHDIVLVDIDEQSIRALEPVVGRWPWPRVIHARLIDYLSRAPVRVVAYDVLFTDRDRTTSFRIGDSSWSGSESDKALAEATARAGNVIYAADVTFGGAEGVSTPGPVSIPPFALDSSFEERPVLAPPFGELAAASHGIGHNYFVLDADGPLRHLVPFVRVGERFVPSLGVAAALSAAGVKPEDVRLENGELHLGRQVMPLQNVERAAFSGDTGNRSSQRALIRFTGPALLPDGKTPTYRTFSFYDLFYSQEQLLADQKPLIDPGMFRDAVVIVGSSAAGLHDVFSVPMGSTGKMTGMQIHANVADGVLSSRFVRPLPTGTVVGAAVFCGLMVGMVAVFASPWTTVAAAVPVTALFAWLSVLLFTHDLWLGVFQPFLAIALAVFGGVTYQYVDEGREKRRIKKLFSRYVAPDVFNQLMTDPSRARLGGQRRDMTVLFSDIRGFTTVSERGQPEEIVAQLNEYFSRMVDALFSHQGTLDKFVGDMVMALFGAPLEDPDHADHALRAALAMVRELGELNQRWAAKGRPVLDIGIGINSGEMVAGNIGSDTIMSYTVIGDAVNLGARLESLNKEYGTRIIISGQTVQRLKGRYDLRPLGSVVVKGKSEAVAIFEVKPGETV